MSQEHERILRRIDSYRDEMVEALKDIIRIPAISPDYGGEGEKKKADRIKKIVESWGFDSIEEINAPDDRAEGKVRPNLLLSYGKQERKVWIISHMDVVPPGDLAKWSITSPFEPIVKEGKIYGRGSEDNGQSLISSLFAAKALIDERIDLKRSIGIILVSDEETGSKYGLDYVLKTRPDLIKPSDLVLVPDGGSGDGSFIEIAEKSILWLRFIIEGKQVHASLPDKGFNAHRVGASLASNLDRILSNTYTIEDKLFEPPRSTFELTMARSSSDSPNIIPGRYEFVLDSRVLPNYRLDDVMEKINTYVKFIGDMFEANINGEKYPKIRIEVLQRSDAPQPTSPESDVVKILRSAIKLVRGIDTRVGGIGGGTVAALLRKRGIPAAVWSTIDETAHQPNEYAKIDNLVSDSKVFSLLPIL